MDTPARPLTTSFCSPWLTATTLKGSREPFHNLKQITGILAPEKLQSRGAASFDISEEIAPYAARDTAPIPGVADREYYWGEDHAGYWLSGLADALKLARQATRRGFDKNARYFELGCASGRVVRHIAFHTAARITCCDINRRHTEWVRLFLPAHIAVFHNSTIPHLPLEDNSVDVAAAFSVFTHIDDFEAAWLLELRRILRPGGLAYLTLATDHTWNQYKTLWIKEQFLPLADRITEYALNEQFFAGPLPSERTVFWWPTEGDVYNASVFHHTEYIYREWRRIFSAIEIIPDAHFYQDVVLLTK